MKIMVDTLTDMRNRMLYHCILGEYKEYVNVRKIFAQKFVQNPEEARHISRATQKLSIFSKSGRNVLKTWFKELFRKKTPEEIEMKKIAEQWKAEEISGWQA